ncbi:MAG: hypothetical protein JNM95_05290 [Chitinophagaceae bacterium]|nr:hypothetical protein [Chitinophagaceae bacterium]
MATTILVTPTHAENKTGNNKSVDMVFKNVSGKTRWVYIILIKTDAPRGGMFCDHITDSRQLDNNQNFTVTVHPGYIMDYAVYTVASCEDAGKEIITGHTCQSYNCPTSIPILY